jgi:hypothetical protein
MNAAPLLKEVAEALAEVRLEAVMIGMAAAYLQGAPVVTHDVDFVIRPTKANDQKLAKLAVRLGGVVSSPYEGASSMRRIKRAGMQLDFLVRVDPFKSFEGLRRRSTRVSIGPGLLVADLDDIIRSKKAAGRPKDRAVMPVLEATAREKAKRKT